MEVTITINDTDQIKLLNEVAAENLLTIEQYASNIVTGWLFSQLKGKYIDYVQQKNLEDLRDKIGSYDTLSNSEVGGEK